VPAIFQGRREDLPTYEVTDEVEEEWPTGDDDWPGWRNFSLRSTVIGGRCAAGRGGSSTERDTRIHRRIYAGGVPSRTRWGSLSLSPSLSGGAEEPLEFFRVTGWT